MHFHTSLDNTTLRLNAISFPPAVTQADMPIAERRPGLAADERFDAYAYRIYSADGSRSGLFRFSHAIRFTAAGRCSVSYMFRHALAGFADSLELQASQLERLRAENRFVPLYRGPRRNGRDRPALSSKPLPGSPDAHGTFKVGHGPALVSNRGPLPDALLKQMGHTKY